MTFVAGVAEFYFLLKIDTVSNLSYMESSNVKHRHFDPLPQAKISEKKSHSIFVLGFFFLSYIEA